MNLPEHIIELNPIEHAVLHQKVNLVFYGIHNKTKENYAKICWDYYNLIKENERTK